MDKLLIPPIGLAIAIFSIYLGYPGGLVLAFLPAIYCEIASHPPEQATSRSRKVEPDPLAQAYSKAVLPVAFPFNLGVLLSPLPLAAIGFGLFTLGVVTPKPTFGLLNGAGIIWMVLAIGTLRDYTFDPLRRRKRPRITKVYGYQALVALAIFAFVFIAAYFAARQIPAHFNYVRFSPVHLAGFSLGIAGLFLTGALKDEKASLVKDERARWDSVFGAITSKTEGLPVLEDIEEKSMVRIMTFRAGLIHAQSSENAVSSLGDKLSIGTGGQGEMAALFKINDGLPDPNLFLICEKNQDADISKTEDGDEARALIEIEMSRAQIDYGDPTTILYLTDIALCTTPSIKANEKPNILYLRKPAPAQPEYPTIFMGTPNANLELIYEELSGLYDPGNTSLNALEGRLIYGDTSMEHLSADSPLGQALSSIGPDMQDSFDEVKESIEVGAEWASHFAQITIKGISDTNRPRLQWAVRTNATYDGNEILSESFLTRQGVEMDQILTSSLEKQLSTTLQGAGFVSAVPFYMRGARHPLAFTVRYCESPMPLSPELVKEDGRTSPGWIIKHQLDTAFDKVKFPRPDLMESKCLTLPASRKSLWQLRVRLAGGVTGPMLRDKADKVASALCGSGVFWIGPGSHAGEVTIVTGAHYRDTCVKLKPSAPLDLLANLAWQNAFSAVRVAGSSGVVPEVVQAKFLPSNPKIERIEFKTPPGITTARVKEKLPALMAATSNAFLTLGETKDPTHFALLVSPEDPVPFPAPPKWEVLDETEPLQIPFCDLIDGTSGYWDMKSDPHLMVAGGTGSGKSITADYILASALAKGVQVCLIDTQKRGADFKMLLPFMAGMATNHLEASALMETIYDEVKRRVDLNAKYGAQTIDDLPDEVRPPHFLVFIDEFTSLVMPDKLPPKPVGESPEVIRDWEEARARRDASLKIGTLCGRLTLESRSAGIHVCAAGQKFNSKTLSSVPSGTVLRTNMARLYLGKANYTDLAQALRDPSNAPSTGDDPPKGRGVFEPMSGSAVLFQTWYDHPPSETIPAMLNSRGIGEAEKIDFSGKLKISAPVFEGDIISSEGEDLGVIDFSSVDFGALVDEDETAETATDQGCVTDETSVDSFADLFSEGDLEVEESEPEVELVQDEPALVSGPLGNETPPESSEPDPGSSASHAEQVAAPDSNAGITEQDRVLDSSAGLAEQESFSEPNEPVDSRGRGTYDPFA